MFSFSTNGRLMLLCGWGVFVLALTGCAEKIEYQSVTGTITLDNEPLPNAFISFIPQGEEGLMSTGQSDEQGVYSLRHGADLTGAPIGTYRVQIYTYIEGRDDIDPPRLTVPERVPMKYNSRSDMIHEVQEGENKIDFPLDSNGEIIQPMTFEED